MSVALKKKNYPKVTLLFLFRRLSELVIYSFITVITVLLSIRVFVAMSRDVATYPS